MKEDELKIMFPLALVEINDMIRNCREKYPDDDVKDRMDGNPREALGKMMSHISKWLKSEMWETLRDKDNKQMHMASVAFWALCLLEDDVEREADCE